MAQNLNHTSPFNPGPMPAGSAVPSSTSQQQQQQQTALAQEGETWKLKLVARGLGTVGGFLCLAMGLFACLTFRASCLASGLLQMFIGFIAVTFEAPCCCMFLDFIQQLTAFSESRPHWQKAILYCSLSVIPLFLCFEISTFFALAVLFVSGMFYGMMALGKKADRDTMIARLTGQSSAPAQDNMNINLMTKDKQPNFFSA